MPCDDSEGITKKVGAVIQSMVVKRGFSPTSIQILTAQNNTNNGVSHLNKTLRDAFNKPSNTSKSFRLDGTRYFVGDKIIWQRNNKELGLNNGDMGVISDISPRTNEVSLEINDGFTTVPFKAFREASHAFAISIHKSQGSEFDAVIIPVDPSHTSISKKLLYTAVTRGKKMVVLISSKESLVSALNENNHEQRVSNLGYQAKAVTLIQKEREHNEQLMLEQFPIL
jgi:exodeoxyribonuclease V alpha subunit